MAVSIDIITALDERSVELAARRIETRLTAAGATGAEAITKAIEAESARTHLAADKIGAELSNRLGVHGKKSGTEFAANLVTGIKEGFHEGEFESIIGALSSGRMLAKATASGNLMGAALVGGLTAAAGVALAGFALEVGEQFEGINRQITLNTAASGEALESLKAHADGLVGTLSSTAAAVGADMGTLSTRLNLEAGGALDKLTQHVAGLRDRFGSLNIDALSAAFVQFGISGEQADNALASVVASARQAGGNVFPQLIQNLAQFAPVAKDVGLNLEQTARFLADLAKQGVPVQQAMGGMEQASKAWLKVGDGQSFPDFIKRAAAEIEHYNDVGNKTARDQLAADVFGTKKWSDAKPAAEELLAIFRAAPDAFKQTGAYTDQLLKDTQNLHNLWLRVQNTIKHALAAPGLNIIDEVNEKMEHFSAWVTAHQDDLKRFFETSLSVIGEVVHGLGDIAVWLGKHKQLVEDVAIAYGAWKGIKGVLALIGDLKTVAGVLGSIPGLVTTAAGSLGELGVVLKAALGPLATLLTLLNLHGSAPDAKPQGDVQAKSDALEGFMKAHPGPTGKGLADKYEAWLQDKGPIPEELKPYYQQAPPVPAPVGGGPDVPALGGPFNPAPPTPPEPPSDRLPLRGAPRGAPPRGAPPPGGSLLDQFGKDGKGPTGPRLPEAPVLPYGAGYGAGPTQGESPAHYSSRQRILEVEHQIEEDRARVQQLEQDNNATARDIQEAKNKLAHDEQEAQQARLRLQEEEQGALKKYASGLKEGAGELEQVGATIDKDLGISKGLSGIAENLTKFLANLAFAPVMGAMRGVQAGLGFPGGQGSGSGIIGMIASAAGLGAPSHHGGGIGGGGWPGLPGGFPGMPRAGTGLGPGGPMSIGEFAASLPGQAGEHGLQPASALLRRTLFNQFPQLSDIGGYRASDQFPWHPTGRALDVMIPGGETSGGRNPQGKAFGDMLYQWLGQNAGAFGINMGGTLWQQPEHYNHIHVQLQGSMPGGFNPGWTGQQGIPGGFSPPPLPGPPGGGPGAGPAGFSPGGGGPGFQPAALGGAGLNWDALAGKESGGNWGINSGNGYYGGLQFDQATWQSYGGLAFAPNAAQATKDQQIQVAQRALKARGGPQSLWPQNWGQLGWQGGMPGAMPSMASGGEVPIMAHQGEHVLTSQDVAKMGGQGGVYDFRRALHENDNDGAIQQKVPNPQPPAGPVTVPPAPPALGGQPMIPVAQPKGGPAAGPSMIGTIGAPAGHGPGFTVTGGGLVGLAESLPATAASMAAEGGAAAAALYGGAIEDLPRYDEGGTVPPPAGGTGGSPGGASGGMGGTPGGSVISAAINIGMQELNAAISSGGQAAGAIVGGLQQTFGPQQFAQTSRGQQSWVTRFVGGIMGAQPQLPNLAGVMSRPGEGGGAGYTPPGLTPEQAVAAQGAPGPPAGGVPAGAPTGDTHNHNFNIQEYHVHGDDDQQAHLTALTRQLNVAYNNRSLTGSA